MIVEMKGHTFQPVVVFPVAPECRQTNRAKLTSRVGTNPIFNSTRPKISGERPVNGWFRLPLTRSDLRSGGNGKRAMHRSQSATCFRNKRLTHTVSGPLDR